MAYLIVLRFEDDEKSLAQQHADDNEEWLIGAFWAPDETTPYCKCDEQDKRKFFGNTFNPRVFKDKTGAYRCKICKLTSSLTNTMPVNLRPKKDPDRRLNLRYWNRPWIGEKSYKNYDDRADSKNLKEKGVS